MKKRNDAALAIFLRYAFTNVLILVLPMILAGVYYAISYRAIRANLDTITASQLSRSMADVEKLFDDMDNMSTQLTNDYEINYYLSRSGPFDGIQFYNIREISSKLFSHVLANPLLSHAFLYMEKSGMIVWENGFAGYDGFYGTLFTSEGYTAARWRDEVLRSPGRKTFFPRQTVSMGGYRSSSHLYRRHIGYGEYFLGSIIGVIDRGQLDRMLSDLPSRYGGWVYIRTKDGGIISSTSPDLEQVARLDAEALGAETIPHAGETYRLYRMSSRLNDWEYIAVLNDTRVLAGVRTIRNTAFVLLGVCFVIGLGFSSFLAFANTKPLRRLFTLVLGEQGKTRMPKTSIYEQVEQAIELLSEHNRALRDELRAGEKITRAYFFQNLLQGNYRTREEFANERRLFNIALADRPYYVILCRLAPLHAAGSDESFPALRSALMSALEPHLGPDNFIVPVSFDDVAVIRCVPQEGSFRTDAEAFIAGVRSRLELRADLSFGAGLPVPDPFLLIISGNQAAAAVSFMRSDGHSAFLFYDDIPKETDSYYYPIDLEENLMKAVRSSNEDLLDSLIETICAENFRVRTLQPLDARNLFIALQGTALRLLSDLPTQDTGIRARLAQWSERKPEPENLAGYAEVLRALIRAYEAGKSSRSIALVASIRQYIEENYSRPDLGLTVIADRFGKSENYLSNFYKDRTGERLSETIQRVRFERAISLILETDESIDRIALLCGYQNPGSFRRAFRRRCGLAPSEYRAKLAAGNR